MRTIVLSSLFLLLANCTPAQPAADGETTGADTFLTNTLVVGDNLGQEQLTGSNGVGTKSYKLSGMEGWPVNFVIYSDQVSRPITLSLFDGYSYIGSDGPILFQGDCELVGPDRCSSTLSTTLPRSGDYRVFLSGQTSVYYDLTAYVYCTADVDCNQLDSNLICSTSGLAGETVRYCSQP